jgi:heme O synthase-like polyprenyltransferase
VRAINAVLGTLLVASGTGTLNQYIERQYDAQMRRTARRPLAAGRLKPSAVLWFGVTLSLVGSVYLVIAVNVLASVLAISTLLSYLFVYTPLKRKTPLCTLVGAFPGAMPTAHWLGCRIRQARIRSMDTLRCALPVAVSPLHGDCMDVPRRLRSRRIPCTPS